MTDYESQGVIKEEALVLQALEDRLVTEFGRTPEYRLIENIEFNTFTVNHKGRVKGLRLRGFDKILGPLGSITEEICSLTSLEYLYLSGQDISHILVKIEQLTNLKRLDLSFNPIEEIPHEIMELNNLEAFYLSGEKYSIPEMNVLPLLKSVKFKGNLEIEKLWYIIQKDRDKKREEQKKLQSKMEKYKIKHGRNCNSIKIVYPPNCSELLKTGQFEYLILLLLKKNLFVSWNDFTSKPYGFHISVLSNSLFRLLYAQFIYKPDRAYYAITKTGRDRLKELSKEIKKNQSELLS